MTSHTNVGASSAVLFGYTLLLIGIHFFIPHPSATKKVIALSYTSLILLALAQASIVGTYYMPRIDNICICHQLWSAALIFYVVALYTIKFIYIERVQILNQNPMLASKKVAKWIKILKYSLFFSCLVCVTMMMFLTDGECHKDSNKYGCKPSFHTADVYLAIVMILFDAILFAWFCYKWWGLIKVFRLSTDSEIIIGMIQSFAVQFVLTVIAMLSCIVDGVINLYTPDYSTLIVFCLDAAVVASCNFALIKESQAFMWKYLCWPCRMPSYVARGKRAKSISASKSNEDGKSVDNVEVSCAEGTASGSDKAPPVSQQSNAQIETETVTPSTPIPTIIRIGSSAEKDSSVN